MTRVRRFVVMVGVAVGAVALAAGCTSDPNNDLNLGSAETDVTAEETSTSITQVESTTTATAMTTIAETTTTAAPPTSAAVETTIAPTAPTTVAATDTIYAPDTPEGKVEADYRAGRDALTQCNYDPVTCDFDAVAAPASPYGNQFKSAMAEWVVDGLRVIEGNGSFLYKIEGIELSVDTSYVTTCSVDSFVTFAVGDISDPSDDLVFDDSVTSRRTQWEMLQVDDHWRLFQSFPLERADGVGLCTG